VRLVHDQHVVRRQEPVGAGGAREQGVVHDHEPRLGGTAPCAQPEALAPAPAGGRRARGRIGGDTRAQPPERVAVERVEAIEVAGWVARGPLSQRLQELVLECVRCPGPRREQVCERILVLVLPAVLLWRLQLERARAQVVLLALQDRERQLEPQGLEQSGNIALVELVLERARGGRHHHALIGPGFAGCPHRVQSGREQVGERLADAGGRLGEQHAAALDRLRHLDRERALSRALLPSRPGARERAALEKRALDAGGEAHQNTLTRRRWMRPSRKPRPGARP
jgi:hypothetical protein